jgi:hypothetical protein
MSQDRDQWWTLVNIVMNLGIHKRQGISLCLNIQAVNMQTHTFTPKQ